MRSDSLAFKNIVHTGDTSDHILSYKLPSARATSSTINNILVNVHNNNDYYNATNIAVNPINPNNILEGSEVELHSVDPNSGYVPAYFYSTNGGNTWNGGTFQPSSYSPPANCEEQSYYPSIAFDAAGTGFICYFQTYGGSGWTDPSGLLGGSNPWSPTGIYLQKTTNGGAAWLSNPIPVIDNISDGNCDKMDVNWSDFAPSMACDATTGATKNNIYVAWTRAYTQDNWQYKIRQEIFFAMSTNGGATFSAPTQINSDPGNTSENFESKIIVGPNGSVYVLWYSQTDNSIYLCQSTNGGQSFGSQQQIVASVHECLDVENSVEMGNFPVMAFDMSGGQYNGNAYIAWTDVRPLPDNQYADEVDVFFMKGIPDGNGGLTWSSPARLNNDPENNAIDHWGPALCVNSDGVLNIMYYSNQNDPNNLLTDVYVAASYDGGQSFTYTQVNSESFALQYYLYSGNFIGLSTGIASVGKMVYPCWTDTRGWDVDAAVKGQDIYVALLDESLNMTLDQKYDDGGGASVGTIGRWNGSAASFSNSARLAVPASVSFSRNTTEYLDGDHSIYLNSGENNNQKYNNWKFGTNDLTDVTNWHSFLITGNFPSTLISDLKSFNINVTVQNTCELPTIGVGGSVNFTDPWHYDINSYPDGTSSGGTPIQNHGAPNSALAYPVNSPFTPSGAPYNGVFLGAGGTNLSNLSWPYYSVQASGQYLSKTTYAPKNLPLAPGDWLFQGWATTNAGVSTPNSLSTHAVFNSDGATVGANYKAHLATLNGVSSSVGALTGLPTNSQRTMVFTGNIWEQLDQNDTYTWYAMMYIDNGRLYFAVSSDAGTTWLPETRIDRTGNYNPTTGTGIFTGYVGSASMCMRSDGKIGIIYEDDDPQMLATHYGIPSLCIATGMPTFDGNGGMAWSYSSDPLIDQTQYSYFGIHPVIAPRVVSGNQYGWWISWVVPYSASASGYLAPGIYAAITAQPSQISGIALMVPQQGANPLPYQLQNSWYTFATQFPNQIVNYPGDNPSITASFADAPFAAKGTIGSPEGSTLHIAWDMTQYYPYGGIQPGSGVKSSDIDYTELSADNNSGVVAPIMPVERPSISVGTVSSASVQYPYGQIPWNISRYAVNGRPSLGVDDYNDLTNAQYEEPVVAWEKSGQGIFVNMTNWLQLQEVIINRRGKPRNPKPTGDVPWANTNNLRKYPVYYVTNTSDGEVIDHPSITTFPADDKTMAPVPSTNDLQAIVGFHYLAPTSIYGYLGGNFTMIGNCYYGNTMMSNHPVYQPTNALDPDWPRNATGMVEQHFSYDKYSSTMFTNNFARNPVGYSTRLLYKEYSDNGAGLVSSGGTSVPVYNFGTPHSVVQDYFGKDLSIRQGDFGHQSQTYMGAQISVDTLGAASLLVGEAFTYSGADSTAIPMVCVSPTILDSTQVGISKTIRSQSFQLTSGMAVSAAVYLLSDSISISQLMRGSAVVSYYVNVVDSVTGQVIIPMYHITLGGHQSQLNLPATFPMFTYSGSTHNAAYINEQIQLSGIADSLCGIGGMIVQNLSLNENGGFFKKISPHNPFTMTPTDQLKIFPNPTDAWSQFEYNIYQGGHVQVQVFDMLGRMVKQVVDKNQSNGHYALSFNTQDLPSGFYKVNIYVDGNLSSVGDMIVKK
jgi:hypothetical protein